MIALGCFYSPAGIVFLQYPFYVLFQAADNFLFQPGNIGLGDAQQIRHLLLGVLAITADAEAQLHDGLLPRG